MFRARISKIINHLLICAGCLVAILTSSAAPVGGSTQPTATTENHAQLILVLAPDWNASAGKLYAFDRDAGGRWTSAEITSGVVLGRKGIAWGIGLHGRCKRGSPCKREGDERAPAGIFELNEIFGEAKTPKLRFPYRRVTANTEAIDDPRSAFYNRLVDAGPLTRKDWNSSERMLRADEIYHWGIVVRHNWQQQPGSGSCIFLHAWQAPGISTSGCTAMPPHVLQKLIRWLDRAKQPILVQLPLPEYRRKRTAWQLPLVR